MNTQITENVQASIRPGDLCDTFYYGDTNSSLQAFPCIVNNKFIQNFTTMTQGTSQFVISPYQGVSDIILYMKMSDLSGNVTNGQLPEAFGYSMIEQVSVRYGSSAQYFWSGDQLFLEAMYDCEDSKKRDQLASLGGAYTDDFIDNPQPEAYVYLKLPHNSPRADGKPLPFPSDLLVQPIIITVQLKKPSSVFVRTNGAGDMVIESSVDTLSSAQLQVKQEMMSDSADLLARRVDMNSHAYTFMCPYFPQQEVQIAVGAGSDSPSAPVSVNLTGFRAGEVRNILLWLTSTEGVADNGSLYWEQIKDIQLTYNGEIFFKSTSNGAQIWNLVCDTKEPGTNLAVQDDSGNPTSYLSTYVDIPFAQVNVPYDKQVKLVHGKPILNAVVNLSFTTPAVLNGTTNKYTLHAVYLYNSSLLCSRGSAEYIF